MAMTKLTKDKFIPFLDVSDTIGTEGWSAETATWKRIDLSTIFALNPNAQEESYDYICYESAVTEVTSYQPELPQEIAIYEGNAIYNYLFEKFYDLSSGALNVPFLLCFGGEAHKAWLVKAATITLGELNTVEGKLSFTIHLGGNREKGTYTVLNGVPSFSAE